MNKLYTWDEIWEAADDCECNSWELKVKDTARWAVRELVMELLDWDIEATECPEDEVDYYCGLWNIRFDESGMIKSYKYKDLNKNEN